MRVAARLTVFVATLALVAGCAPPARRVLPSSETPAGGAGASVNRAPLPSPSDLQTLLRAERFDELEQSLSALQRQYEEGVVSDEDLRDTYRAFYPTDAQLEAKYNAWVERFPKSYAAHLARAVYYRKVASVQRGGAYIDKTTNEQIQNMTSTLKKAAEDVQVSFELTPKPILSLVQAIDMAGTLGAPDHGRALLDRAIALDAGAYIARLKYMAFLNTRWGGSLEEMQAFLEESRHSRLSKRQLDTLESLVFEEQGWLHVHEDGDAGAALRDYEHAKSLNPAVCLRCAKLEMSELLTQQRKYTEAVAMLSGVIGNDPSDLDALDTRAQTYMAAGMRAEAIADWKRAAEAGDAAAQNQMGAFYMNGVPGVLDADIRAGLEWFQKSAAQGDPAGKKNVDLALMVIRARSQGFSSNN